MRRVILESPFTGDIKRNVNYAKMAVRDSLLKGESPFASHLIFPQPGILDDNKPEDRKLGIDAGHEWTKVADAVVVYIDHGISVGMLVGIKKAEEANIPVEYRKILPPPTLSEPPKNSQP